MNYSDPDQCSIRPISPRSETARISARGIGCIRRALFYGLCSGGRVGTSARATATSVRAPSTSISPWRRSSRSTRGRPHVSRGVLQFRQSHEFPVFGEHAVDEQRPVRPDDLGRSGPGNPDDAAAGLLIGAKGATLETSTRMLKEDRPGGLSKRRFAPPEQTGDRRICPRANLTLIPKLRTWGQISSVPGLFRRPLSSVAANGQSPGTGFPACCFATVRAVSAKVLLIASSESDLFQRLRNGPRVVF